MPSGRRRRTMCLNVPIEASAVSVIQSSIPLPPEDFGGGLETITDALAVAVLCASRSHVSVKVS